MDAISLEALQQLNQTVVERRVIDQSPRKTGSRLSEIRDAGIGVGARGGLAAQSAVINKAIDTVKRNLDTVFDFSPLLIQGRIIPPVLTETREIYTQGDANTLRLAGLSYKIESQPRFSSRPPNWRDYLAMNYSTIEMPDKVLFPKNDDEREIWKQAVAEGWALGERQADEMLASNRARLVRDYKGMTRYHILALKNMVTIPVVASQSMSINSTADTMSLDETLLRITTLPQFNVDMKGWTPLGTEGGLMQRPDIADPAKKGK